MCSYHNDLELWPSLLGHFYTDLFLLFADVWHHLLSFSVTNQRKRGVLVLRLVYVCQMHNGLPKYFFPNSHLRFLLEEKSEVVKAGRSFLLSMNTSDAIVQQWQPLLTDPSIPGAAFLSRISPFMAPHSRIFKATFQENPSHKKIPLLMSWWSRGVKLLFLSHCVLWEMDVSVNWMGSISTRPQHRPAALLNDSMSPCPLCWAVRHCGELGETGNASNQGVPNRKTYPLLVLNNTFQTVKQVQTAQLCEWGHVHYVKMLDKREVEWC